MIGLAEARRIARNVLHRAEAERAEIVAREIAQERPSCPECGGPVAYDLTSHTYQQSGRWSACMPCDSAVEYQCVAGDENEGCGWSYTHGLNPKNPRAAWNEEFRPPWLPDESPRGEAGVHSVPGVPPIWDLPQPSTES